MTALRASRAARAWSPAARSCAARSHRSRPGPAATKHATPPTQVRARRAKTSIGHIEDRFAGKTTVRLCLLAKKRFLFRESRLRETRARRRETPRDAVGFFWIRSRRRARVSDPTLPLFPSPVVSHDPTPNAVSYQKKIPKKKKNADAALRSRRRDFLVAQALAAATATQALVPADAWSALENADALPKDYAEKARAVVKALTESLEFESAGAPTAAERFRKAEPAKEAVKAFIKDWAAAPAVQGERSHDDIVLAVRELSEFYKANGSRAALDKPTRDSVLEKLYDARDALPKAPPTLADRLLGL